MAEDLVLGLDVGGTATRAAVVSLAGAVVGTGRAGGGNPTSHGAEPAARELGNALRAALAGTDAGRVRAGFIGLAGLGRVLSDPGGRAAFDRAWADAGLRCPYTMDSDALVAYASATSAATGTVLIAGTGAVAAAVHDLCLVHTADGHGWLLGDAGSGFWLGREAVRHSLLHLDTGRQPGPLIRALLTDLVGPAEPDGRRTTDLIVQAVTRRQPIELARLAPVVLAAHTDGDPLATQIVTEAAGLLTGSVAVVRAPDQTGPVVLAGGLLAGTALADAVGAALSTRWPSAPLLPAGDGAVGAAWLAARALPDMDPDRAAALHARLTGAA
ncbi:N-acetylglucosamine kinase [Plantactinospora sp. GCM10030261]|uniref:N-acetylglucosamine kinase n=1 Tax=Plantactinospora sp. GCM10030261 TaxID=3273420 RepID=UPI003617FE1A